MNPYEGYSSNNERVPPPRRPPSSPSMRDGPDPTFPPRREFQQSEDGNGRRTRKKRGGVKARNKRDGGAGESGPGPSRNRGGRGGFRADPYDRDSGRGGNDRREDGQTSPSYSSVPQAGPPLRVDPTYRATGSNSQLVQQQVPYESRAPLQHPPALYDRRPQMPQPVAAGYGHGNPPSQGFLADSAQPSYQAPPLLGSDPRGYASQQHLPHAHQVQAQQQAYPAAQYPPYPRAPQPPPHPVPALPPSLPLSRPPPSFTYREFHCRALEVTSRGSAVEHLDLRSLLIAIERDVGDVKKWWRDTKRGGEPVLGISFWDTRAAAKAKDLLERWDTRAERLDVKFGMPIADRELGRAGPEHDQGTLFAFAAGPGGMSSNPRLTDSFFYSVFAPFGELRELRPFKTQANARFVDFYDSRCAYEAYEKINRTSFDGNRWDIKFAWDLNVSAREGLLDKIPLPGPPIHRGPPRTPAPEYYGGEHRIVETQFQQSHYPQPTPQYQPAPPPRAQPELSHPYHLASQHQSYPPAAPSNLHSSPLNRYEPSQPQETHQWHGQPQRAQQSPPQTSHNFSHDDHRRTSHLFPPASSVNVIAPSAGYHPPHQPAGVGWQAKRAHDSENNRERLEAAQKVQQLLSALTQANSSLASASQAPAAPTAVRSAPPQPQLQASSPPPPAAPAASMEGLLAFLAQQKQQS